MKYVFFIFCFFSTALFTTTAQTEIGDIVVPDTETYGKHQLVLNGAGIREKFWINMYVGGLYLPHTSTNAQKIWKSGKPLGVKIHIVSSLINSKRMSEAVNDGFQKSTEGRTAQFSEKIQKLMGFFSEEINKHDVFDITYQPELGVVVYKNKKVLGTIEGIDFKNALFGIWLSDHPANEKLQKAMLGK